MSMKTQVTLILATLLCCAGPAHGGAAPSPVSSPDCKKDVQLMLPTFDTRDTQYPDLGRHVPSTLSLQTWQTLRRPDSGKPTAGITWDIVGTPPVNFQDADTLAAASCEDSQIVIWGRTWHYGDGYVLDPTLTLRVPKDPGRALQVLWDATVGN